MTRNERLHRVQTFCRFDVGHFKRIRHTGSHRPTISLVALNHKVIFSQHEQDLGHTIPVGLAHARGSRYSLRQLLMGRLQLFILSPQVLHLTTGPTAPGGA